MSVSFRTKVRRVLSTFLPNAAVQRLRSFNTNVLMVFWLPLPYFQGQRWARRIQINDRPAAPQATNARHDTNPLQAYFDGVTEGPGVLKWLHYFEIYHRHLQKFVGRPVSMVEVGIFSGGSLAMWHSYFGDQCRLYGVDIEEGCRVYESEKTKVFIGDQESREFWRRFSAEVKSVDVLLDDGGHTPAQQIVTLEEMLPRLNLGGVYICEDVTGVNHAFRSYVNGLVNELNRDQGPLVDIQKAVHSVHFYPYIIVIEKHAVIPESFRVERHGSEWQPFLGPNVAPDTR
jgi:hypothetical protein